jgi:hypothetical protein
VGGEAVEGECGVVQDECSAGLVECVPEVGEGAVRWAASPDSDKASSCLRKSMTDTVLPRRSDSHILLVTLVIVHEQRVVRAATVRMILRKHYRHAPIVPGAPYLDLGDLRFSPVGRAVAIHHQDVPVSDKKIGPPGSLTSSTRLVR